MDNDSDCGLCSNTNEFILRERRTKMYIIIPIIALNISSYILFYN